MTSLQDICTLPVDFDENSSSVRLDEAQINCTNRCRISIDSLTPTLLNKSLTHPRYVYSEYSLHHKDDQDLIDKGLNYELIVLPAGLLGIEYIRSHIYFKASSPWTREIHFSSIVEGVYGTVTLLMQKNCEDSQDEVCVEEGLVFEIKPRTKVAIPEGWFYTFVNTGEEPAILARVYRYKREINEELTRTKGLAYFCIRKNAKQEFVYNPRFRHIPPLRRMRIEENHIPELDFDLEQSLYELIRIKTEKLMQILV